MRLFNLESSPCDRGQKSTSEVLRINHAKRNICLQILLLNKESSSTLRCIAALGLHTWASVFMR
eukprot:2008388-Amphidinium_carterae.1